jgi:phage terminase large subunit-like protein
MSNESDETEGHKYVLTPPVDDITISKGYFGNPNLKRVGEDIEWTESRVSEYIKCSQDPIYFIETYMKIINVDEGLVNFKLYDYQKEMVNSMANNRMSIIATARQAGKSTTTCGFILWYIIFNKEKTVALLANKGDTAREILGRVQLAYQYLPKWLQQGIVEWNKGNIELENKSRVLAGSTSSDNIRGYTINMLFIDEAAFIEGWDEFFTSVFPTISSGKSTKIVLVSTPNGLNHFHKLWAESTSNPPRNDYNPIKVMWYDVPGRDEEWRNAVLRGMSNDQDRFNQEYCVEFLGSSNTLIGGQALKDLVHRDPIYQHDGLYKYFEPQRDHLYACIVDVSQGKGLDYSAFSIIDVTSMPYQQVVAFRNNLLAPADYAKLLYATLKAYNNCVVLVELNDWGHTVSSILWEEYEYEGVLFTENAGRAGKRICSGFGGKSVDMGVRTTSPVKNAGCSLLKLLIEQRQLMVHDYNTIGELATFSLKGKQYQAESGHHDDLVMGLVLFAWMTDQPFFKEYTDINTLIKLREKTDEEIESDLTPFGFLDDHFGDEEMLEPEAPAGWNWMGSW